MKLLPYENIEILSPLSPPEAQSALKREVKSLKLSGFGFASSEEHAYFDGFLENYQFKFNRKINYRNSFLPTISGSINSDLMGSRVVAKMRLAPVVSIFSIIWLGVSIFACIALSVKIFGTEDYDPKMLIPFGMPIIGYSIVMGGFHYEAKKAKLKLLELLNGTLA
jgi:hypothetical protein